MREKSLVLQHEMGLRFFACVAIIWAYADGESELMQSSRERAHGCKARVLHNIAPASRVRGEHIVPAMKSAGCSRYRAAKGTAYAVLKQGGTAKFSFAPA